MKWYNKIRTINRIYDQPSNLPFHINNNNILTIKKQIHNIIQFLICHARVKEKSFKNDNIKKFIMKRCQDYRNDQKSMIKSILQIPFRQIVLDRILINNDDNT